MLILCIGGLLLVTATTMLLYDTITSDKHEVGGHGRFNGIKSLIFLIGLGFVISSIALSADINRNIKQFQMAKQVIENNYEYGNALGLTIEYNNKLYKLKNYAKYHLYLGNVQDIVNEEPIILNK